MYSGKYMGHKDSIVSPLSSFSSYCKKKRSCGMDEDTRLVGSLALFLGLLIQGGR